MKEQSSFDWDEYDPRELRDLVFSSFFLVLTVFAKSTYVLSHLMFHLKRC
ncbi:unnamed protein product [Hymenolepis diminuta]|uniref:Uncharacterized protein n=1 Tax=Hymenolepis diminuta TaxID=6216 RepID=A0A564YIT7_HYMDI|nr:unnamed protein product [Hymenolepis diminuta]